VPCRLFDLVSHLVVAFKVEYICDQFKRILVVLNFGIEACQVESVCQVILVDFAKILVPARGYELWRGS
jgi:hypothetical protein